jgi:hypothetical protein
MRDDGTGGGGGGRSLLEVNTAQITRDANGMVLVEDPGAPVRVALAVDTSEGAARLTRITIDVTGPVRLSASALSRLPISQLIHAAAARCGGGYPDEPYYRQLARPKPDGQRGWDSGHWQRVLAVWEWAEQVGRPGGGTQAVADFWGVRRDPTAYRWMKAARGAG